MSTKPIRQQSRIVRSPVTPAVTIVSLHAKALQERFDQLGGEGFFGPLERKEANVWYGRDGCVCYNRTRKQVFEIHGAIYAAWKDLGGATWGMPETDESPCLDGTGRYNHFNNDGATIMWSPQTGAHGVWGDIRKKWAELGWERSYLGYPVSHETDFADGGRVSGFQHGGIYWWPDTGAIDANDVSVRYSGLVCMKETGESSGADEPYVLMGVVTPFATNSIRTRTYGGVDSGTSRPDVIELYRGKPNGIKIGLLLMENDEGDPDKYREEITKAVEKVHHAGTLALGAIPIVGAGIAAVLGPLIQKFVPNIGQAINDLFGFGDDRIGFQDLILTGKDMLILSKRAESSRHKNVEYRFRSNNLRGQNANYIVYFDLVSA